MSRNRLFNPALLPLAVTSLLFVLTFGYGAVAYTGFLSSQVFLNLLIDNAFLLVVAIGMSLVILTGGIDLSVGSIIALVTMVSASLVEHHHWPVYVVVPLCLAIGAGFGALMGCLIHFFQLQPFIVTLGGMFLARGLCYVISIDSIEITDPAYMAIAHHKIMLWGENFISINVVIALAVVALGVFLAHYTRFGRTVYAIGGNERSAVLMGLPVGRTKILVYTFSGTCSALAGVVVTFYMLSGYGLHAQGMELDAIAAVVIGGTLLTGGVGYVAGSLVGVLILGVIQSLITFDGTLNSWWTRIAVGVLLCAFCLLQRGLEHGGKRQLATA
ncbi:galactofuranose ABC transporter, permease protein YjfF [Niveibacterium sp. COAC-50]|uniref:galactofuranose ABC transporter, permease protein YjfF n=1 Tax=Niveibacterium sp. COAC-50 TaxID=2729384 RepID=UPI0015535F52|nr:galactofuranose ABC transporter, permease protein YjfF [Niveibacterium sp. COAC-50]